MKFLKIIGLIFLFIVLIAVTVNYPKLKLISGFAAKNMASSYFLAHRGIELTNKEDNNSFLISLAKTKIDTNTRTTTATVFGLSKSTAIYREGVGATLVQSDKVSLAKPNRHQPKILLPYPHGHLKGKDTIFTNINYSRIDTILNNSFVESHPDEIKNSRSVLVLYKGHIIGEKYALGFDENSLLQGWSITKSLLTTSFGILSKNGYKIHQNITAFPNWLITDKKNITTSHLLQMQSGIEWEENYGTICDVTNMLFKDKDCTKRALGKPLARQPGTRFGYESGNSNILSALLRKQFKTHQEYLDFPYRTYIDKIGMHSMTIETDAVGNYVASSYSWATTRDWAKFGLLMLQNGRWNGEQILTKEWIDYIKTPASDSKGEFGGQWWLNKGNYMPNVPKDCFYADGFEGQRIFVIPSKDLVIVRFGVTKLGRVGFYPLFDKLVGNICNSID